MGKDAWGELLTEREFRAAVGRNSTKKLPCMPEPGWTSRDACGKQVRRWTRAQVDAYLASYPVEPRARLL